MSTETGHQVGSHGAGGASTSQEPTAVSVAELWRLARALRGWDETAVAAVARHLGELCAARAELAVSGPWRLPAGMGASRDVVISLAARDGGATCAWLELEPALARGAVDLALGGTADAADLGHVETLDPTRTGVLVYMVASLLTRVPQDALRVLDVLSPSWSAAPSASAVSEAPCRERVACAVRVTLQGRVFGARLSVDVATLPDVTMAHDAAARAEDLPAWARDAVCEVTLELGRGALEAATLAALEPGDVLIPDSVMGEPGAWETALLRCSATPRALATVNRRADGVLELTEARGPGATPSVPAAPGLSAFTVEAARVSARLADVQRWLADGRLPLEVDAYAPLTLWQGQRPLARGHLVRDRSDVGLCIESVRALEPDTHPYPPR